MRWPGSKTSSSAYGARTTDDLTKPFRNTSSLHHAFVVNRQASNFLSCAAGELLSNFPLHCKNDRAEGRRVTRLNGARLLSLESILYKRVASSLAVRAVDPKNCVEVTNFDAGMSRVSSSDAISPNDIVLHLRSTGSHLCGALPFHCVRCFIRLCGEACNGLHARIDFFSLFFFVRMYAWGTRNAMRFVG